MPWSWEHRQRLGHLVAISQQIVAGEAHAVRRELPTVARTLIYPAVESFHDAGDIDRARDWYTVFDAWRRPPSDDD